MHVILSKDGTLVLCKNGTGAVFWHDINLSESTNHRYVVQAPSLDAAERMATTYDGKPGELPISSNTAYIGKP